MDFAMFGLNSNTGRDNNIVQRRFNRSPYVNPNDFFSIPSVKEEIRNMKPALYKLQTSEDDEKPETSQ